MAAPVKTCSHFALPDNRNSPSFISNVLSGTTALCRKKGVKPPLYKVLLHNDNSNKREYVVKVLLKVVDGLTVDDAVNVMNEAHLQVRFNRMLDI
ncbi:MAG: hypothetical protein HC767_11725 [Akkermansiaceae bacterium]|nr:hypothetical protein [Akkermansiaceae bacterium]